MTEAARDELIHAALDAQKRAYAPYSNFPVGAALRTASGKIFQGCNVENASFSLTICAERVAAAAAVAAGDREFVDDRHRQPRRRDALRRLPAVPGRVQPDAADRDGRLASSETTASSRRSTIAAQPIREEQADRTMRSRGTRPPYFSFLRNSAKRAAEASRSTRASCASLMLAVGGERAVRFGDGDLIRQHEDADVAENRPHVHQPAQAAEPAGRRAHQRRHLAFVRRERAFARRLPRDPVDRVLPAAA